MNETGERPSFPRLWSHTFAWTIVWTCVVYVGVFAIGSFVVEVQDGTSIPYALLSAVGGVFWAGLFLMSTGWAVMLVIATIVAVIRYVVALLR